MARVHTWLAVSLLSFSAVGCVSAERYTAARMDSDQYATRLAAVEREKSEAAAARDAYKQQLDNVLLNGNQKDALVTNQASQITDLQAQIADLNRRYTKAASEVGTNIQLPQDLNEALKAFSSQNPDLVDFDQNRGIVKFKSDVTFSPGSAVLTAAASGAIDRFAGILSSPAAAGYDLMVVGHTDNVPVHNAVSQGHKDNWYLSAHRAISVSSELQKHGVTAGRLEVAGFADQRPIADNSSDQGKAMNRRVEVLILPPSGHNTVAAGPAPVSVARTVSMRQTGSKPIVNNSSDQNKDVPAEPHKPSLNK